MARFRGTFVLAKSGHNGGMNVPFRLAALFFFAALVMGPRLEAWDACGHDAVATMAFDHLNPKAKQAVTELARELTGPNGAPYDPVTIACWMDDLRKDTAMPYHGRFLSWHYIDIGIDAGGPTQSLEPGDDNDVHGNVVQALKRAMVVLQGGTDPYIKTKAMALAMVEHLVGDIHQPLHCATKYFYSHGQMEQDLGGNKESVDDGPPGDPKFNLHAFWDSAWRASFDETSGRVLLDARFQDMGTHNAQQVQAAVAELGQQSPPANANLDTRIDEWARESNAYARDVVYPGITATDSKKVCRLSSAYVAKAHTLAQQRLILAAARLATLLNSTIGATTPITPPPSYPAGPPSQPY